uniref:PRORP domain-containing protein n=1 Tax=Parastrongyloides trichosuri TaxID=131310 RepID=A0A0N4ZX67_PARTI
MSSEVALKNSRKKCYASRDIFLECFGKNEQKAEKCRLEYKDFVKDCPASWKISYEYNNYHTFIRKSTLQKYNLFHFHNYSIKRVIKQEKAFKKNHKFIDPLEINKNIESIDDVIKAYPDVYTLEETASENPWNKYANLAMENEITESHIDGTFDVKNYLSSMGEESFNKIGDTITFFCEINCKEDVKNLLNETCKLFSNWNGYLLNTILNGIGYLKYECRLPESEYKIDLEKLESEIKHVPLVHFKLNAENIKDCLFDNKLTYIKKSKLPNYIPNNFFYRIFIKEALLQGKISEIESEISQKFQQNIWNDYKLFNFITTYDNERNDGIHYILKSSLKLNRCLEKKEIELLKFIEEGFKGKYIFALDEISKSGITSCGKRLLGSDGINKKDIQTMVDALNKYISNTDAKLRHGFRKHSYDKYISELHHSKMKMFQYDKDKHYVAVIDGLNLIHGSTNYRFLYKIIRTLKKDFSNVLFVVRSLRNKEMLKNVINAGAVYIDIPEHTDDDLFAISSALILGSDSYILTNDLYRDFKDRVMDKDSKKIFEKWMYNRCIQWFREDASITLPKKYLSVVQGNFEDFNKPFHMHFPICFEIGQRSRTKIKENWFCLRKK